MHFFNLPSSGQCITKQLFTKHIYIFCVGLKQLLLSITSNPKINLIHHPISDKV